MINDDVDYKFCERRRRDTSTSPLLCFGKNKELHGPVDIWFREHMEMEATKRWSKPLLPFS